MSATEGAPRLDIEQVRELFDLRGGSVAFSGGGFHGDPYPIWHELRETGPVHGGTVHQLTGFDGTAFWHGVPEEGRPHFSCFSFDTCDEAQRNPEVFASSPEAVEGREIDISQISIFNSMLAMDGPRHRRYRALVQPSFVPPKAQWWITNWIDDTVHALVDAFEADGRAELNIDFCAAIPVLTITSSFGIPVDQALEVRSEFGNTDRMVEILEPIVTARRAQPCDDLISVLVEAEMTEEDGAVHTLSDPEIYSFAILLLGAGSGTTWKQMGITLTALLRDPELVERVRADRSLLKGAIEESLRWEPTDPMFSRWVTTDTVLGGTELPKGSVLHLCLGAANRDPARWDRPDVYDIDRPPRPSQGFGSGPHICLGMHVARAEMFTAISALLDRLPDLRLDPDAPPPEIIGLYERGATEINVLFGGG
ncbi:MAG: cytochrome P450 [Acidimicrobiia bacterium]|nr:cytochrome P450 [Acidimicrobiia bacterium]